MGRRGEREFSSKTTKAALARQNSYCASCGTRIWAIGNVGAERHRFGERAEAHHVLPVQAGGTAHVDNCVILCRTCHYSAHQAGRWADITIYETPGGGPAPAHVSVQTIAAEYPFYAFTQAKARELARLNKDT
jgi:hypothetical protein